MKLIISQKSYFKLTSNLFPVYNSIIFALQVRLFLEIIKYTYIFINVLNSDPL
jgi:hypothetical protein